MENGSIKKQKGAVVAIGGVSRSGKTALAEQLRNWWQEIGHTVVVVHQDDYVVASDFLPKIRHRIDWERPESIDFDQFKWAVETARAQATIVIAEGLLAFYKPEIVALYDYKLFIDISKDLFLARKKADCRWGKEPKWYIEHIWKSHYVYGRTLFNSPSFPFLYLSGDKKWGKSHLKPYFGDLFNPLS